MRLRWVLLRALACLSMILGVEATSFLGLALLARTRGYHYQPITQGLTPADRRGIQQFTDSAGYLIPHSVLGWTVRPDARGGLYVTTSQGIRGDRRYDSLPAPGVLRIAAFGDSFIHGNDVGNAETWTAQLERSGVEVLNFGVPAYGLDQAYLRYLQDGRRFRPHVVLIGLFAEDVHRGLNVWRPFFEDGLPAAKPRFHLAGDSLVLQANPLATDGAYADLLADPHSMLPQLGATDFFFQLREHAGAFDVSPTVRLAKVSSRIWRERRAGLDRTGPIPAGVPAARLALAVLRQFTATVRADGAVPVLLLLPSRHSVTLFLQDGSREVGLFGDSLAADNVPVLDLHHIVRDTVLDFARIPDRPPHYSPEGNAKVAAAVRAYLDSLTPRSSPTGSWSRAAARGSPSQRRSGRRSS